MLSSVFTRLVLLFFSLTIFSCSSKEKEEVAPVPVKSLVGRWDVLEASVTHYSPDGQYLRTQPLFAADKRYYIFSADGKIEPYTKEKSLQAGSYSNTNNSLSLSFDYGTFQYTIPPTISDTELTVIEDTRNLTSVPESRRNRVTLVQLKKHTSPE
ncbi:hypothetical protein GCM10011375_21260 [Hymenobacter qilianensis]|uniref:Uncharacterized protein n=2 Tax=Hymenobacter qilianensis TaxID=1385715 RepID=A0ACB5PRY2_9BACT|nr:hypothetical protein [Hymenobacter qilianensis]QNP52266.1 hypothetical protein H9L05_00065 [Hymenobacter qilianensis]GGF65979.1 hypothetical protein GCM10011375_21260 [Hymenobacter qilianensis]